MYWDIVEEEVTDLINFLIAGGEMTGKFKKGLVVLLHKKGDRSVLGNWRPITLIDTDYKLFTKILLGRMKEVISKVIHEDQICGIPTRKIHENVTLIRDLLGDCKDRHRGVIMCLLDFERPMTRWPTLFCLKC